MMEEKTTLSGFELFALWFGAAISMAEIFTGGLLAPLGFSDGVPKRSRTPNLLVRSQTLYPIELWVHKIKKWRRRRDLNPRSKFPRILP